MSNTPQSDSDQFDFSAYEADPLVSRDRTSSVPSSHEYPQVEQLPSALAPMSEIAAEGRAFRGLSQGRTPWGIIIFSWLFVAVPMVVLSGFIIYHTVLSLLANPQPLDLPTVGAAIALLALHLMVPTTILLIISRGTIAKFHTARHGNR